MTDAALSSPTPARQKLVRTILHTAWMSILLGIFLELLLTGLAYGFGKESELTKFLANSVQKVSWSFLVCVGLIVGSSAAANLRGFAMGACGLVAAPAAFLAAKAIHRGVSASLSVAMVATPAPDAWLVAVIKGLQYATLGISVAWLSGKSWGGALAHAAAGLMVGAVFGGIILYLSMEALGRPFTPLEWATRGANEVIFPVGCAMIAFAVDALSKRLQER